MTIAIERIDKTHSVYARLWCVFHRRLQAGINLNRLRTKKVDPLRLKKSDFFFSNLVFSFLFLNASVAANEHIL